MQGTSRQKVIVIVGPTASGKSDLALRLAKLAQGKLFKKNGILGAEIISADSRQVYRGMDIGTGKVTKKEQKIIRHHLLDIADPKRQFNASQFKKLGLQAIKEIRGRNKVPVIVGGTGFYIDILLGRMNTAEVPPNKKLRAKLEKQSAEQLFKRLLKLDPLRAKSIDSHNRPRLVRAIEIFMATKKSSVLNPEFVIRNSKFEILWLGINPGKEKLAQNIKIRLDKRIKQGMAEEVEKLHKEGLSWKRLDNFGLEYRWISRWLKEMGDNKQTTKKFINSKDYHNLLTDIIKYSKRQMTWFKKNKEIHWLALNEVEGIKNKKEMDKMTTNFLENYLH